MRTRTIIVACLALLGNCPAEPFGQEDYTSMWWADGFPSVVPGASWQRVIQTGRYAFVLDTKSIAVTHFGKVPAGIDYADCGKQGIWRSLPGAKLELGISVNGKSYRCTAGGAWTRHGGPRLIESGRWFQRADVTDLEFESADGERLNVDARFETAAWSDRLGMVLAAEPGLEPIRAGEVSFGRAGGGFGLDGTNALEIPHAAEIDTEQFTLDFWAFVPADYRVSARVWPWLVCKNHNEMADGNFGILLVNGKAQARMNIGGGRDGAVVVGDRSPRIDAWNHFVMSYDGDTMRSS